MRILHFSEGLENSFVVWWQYMHRTCFNYQYYCSQESI